NGPTSRMLSPSCASTLITSAPNSARIWVANGPMTTVVRSRTLTPDRGPGILLLSIPTEVLRRGGVYRSSGGPPSTSGGLRPPRHASHATPPPAGGEFPRCTAPLLVKEGWRVSDGVVGVARARSRAYDPTRMLLVRRSIDDQHLDRLF